MANVFVKVIFGLLGVLGNAIVKPFLDLLMATLPDAEIYYGYILEFLTQGGTYVICIYRWFLMTPLMFQVLFIYFFVKFSIYVISATISLILRIKKLILV